MSVVFTLPGKLGDALLQYPMAYRWSQENNKRFSLWLDERELKPLVNLFKAQACVETIELKPGIENYNCGGQPYHFNLKTENFIGHTIYHLGFRKFPERQITLQTALDVFPNMNTEPLSQPSLFVDDVKPVDRLVLHGTFTSHQSGVPRFWRFLRDHYKELEGLFDEIVFTGPPADRARALELYPDWRQFDDGGDFLELARLMAGSRLVIGAGSCGVALASVLGVPAVRVHDPIGDLPKVIWSGLGANQLNDTEIGLRKSWPEFRDEWLTARVTS